MRSTPLFPFCLQLFFVFSSEALNSGIKACFDQVTFQDAVENVLVYVFCVFTFSVFDTVFMKVSSLKLLY